MFLAVLATALAMLALAIAASARAADPAPAAVAPVLELRAGDSICLVGNGLGERLQFHNDWEALLYERFPRLDLKVRNLCFPGDEPQFRLRSLNFGSPDAHLTHSKADVILFFFGLNESFAGPAGLGKFTAELTRLVADTKTKNYSGRGAPRIVLVSPIAHENLRDPHIVDGVAHDAQLALYTAAMRTVATKNQVGFVDLFTPTRELFAASPRRLTINGIHLSDGGYQALAPLLDRGLFGPTPAEAKSDPARHAALRAAIDDKNFHWFHRYRAVNGYSIYGTRGEAGFDGAYRNRDVMERERAILDEMCANRDRHIAKIAQGQGDSSRIDDSNTLPFLVPKTNVGGDNDPNRKAGKLGSLDYLPAAEQLKHFKLAPGYEIQLVASEEDFPELANPVAINFDNRGRLWVATMPSYPQWQPKTPMDDKLLILTDENGDGRADRCRTFAGGLHQPTGFEIGGGGVWVAQQPDLVFLQDNDGDDQADVRTRRLIGFDTADSHHGLSAFEWGPDGALYFQEGTFKQSQVESPYGLQRLGDAGVWRYEPRTEKFGVHVSFAMANPWGHVFDRWGQNFVADASPGFNYWATPISGHVEYPDKHPGGSRAKNLDWGGSKGTGDYPVFVPKRTRPSSGCEFVSSRHFPPEAQGRFLLNNVIGDLGVLQHKLRDDGSGFAGEELEPLVMSDHGNFRPVDLQFGPDGALYICDWHNALIGHLQHNLREPHRDHSHGRIWRVVYKDRPLLTPPQIAGAPLAALFELLREPEDRTRYRVRRELAERPSADVVAAAAKWLDTLRPDDSETPRLQLEALWMHQTHDVVNEPLLERLLDASDFHVRAAATRVLGEWRDRVGQPLERLAARVRDPHPRVRLEAVRALSFVGSREALDRALDALDYDVDPFLDYAISETARILADTIGRREAASARGATDPHADHAHHAAGHDHAPPAAPKPVVLLDKNRKIVDYQLSRLSTAQLIRVDRSPDEARAEPVYEAILLRGGVSRKEREAALAVLVRRRDSSAVTELLNAVRATSVSRAADVREAREQLVAHLAGRPAEDLTRHAEELLQAIAKQDAAVRPAACAALATIGRGDDAWKFAAEDPAARRDFLDAIRLVADPARRAALRPRVLDSLAPTRPVPVRQAALDALAVIASDAGDNFQLAAPLVGNKPLRAGAVRVMLAVPAAERPAAASAQVVQSLLKQAEATPAAERTTDEFVAAMRLADELLAKLPAAEAQAFRQRLKNVAVRVVSIKTVHEEMRYDVPYFAVEAGRPVQVVLKNVDLMAHNLVIVAPGALRDVALAAANLPAQADPRGRMYVPGTPNVLQATRLVEPNGQEALTFNAPTKPGEYPYVCTFPNHWMRMYGVMVVVPDLDAWLAKPVKPADPLGNQRDFVKSWTFDLLKGELDAGLRGRNDEIGRKLFKEATCLQCHKLRGEGGAVGPDLTDALTRWKGDRAGLLREVVEPSHKIDDKFAMVNIETGDGRILTGIITEQNAETVTLITNPESPRPQTIAREDIESLKKAPVSMMPKGLLDRYTQDEVFEILSYVIGK